MRYLFGFCAGGGGGTAGGLARGGGGCGGGPRFVRRFASLGGCGEAVGDWDGAPAAAPPLLALLLLRFMVRCLVSSELKSMAGRAGGAAPPLPPFELLL